MSTDGRFSRQSFLGAESQAQIEQSTIGVIGLGGGGSHIVQQLAHVGFLHYVICDPDEVEDSNLNRLVGATDNDVQLATPKIDVARRLILGVRPGASVQTYRARWQEHTEALQECDILFGCIDGFDERRQLEAVTRRNWIPYIDIGMDVHRSGTEAPRMSGQVILSMPGYPCMQCLGFLNEVALREEAAAYGQAGHRPQVVWPNGVLASTAVGIAMDLLTDWTQSLRQVVYMPYFGNDGALTRHIRLDYVHERCCPHYPRIEAGEFRFTKI